MEADALVSVITPSVRPDMLPIIGKCLARQSIEFEWLVVAPQKLQKKMDKACSQWSFYRFIPEPPKKPDDYYALCKAWNKGFSKAKGKLVVNIQDGLWFPPDLLERFWYHYQNNPKGLVTAIGHQYEKFDENGKPEKLVWTDPRSRQDLGSFYQVAPTEMEMALCSVPKQALLDCGGIDEEYDKGAAVGEKEMCWRLDKLGYIFFIDQTLEYRAVKHPRLTKDWDEKYKIASDLYVKHTTELQQGTRQLNVNCLNY